MCSAKTGAVARLEAMGRESRGNDMHRRRDPVVEQHRAHGLRGRDERCDVPALRARKSARHWPPEGARQDRHIVVQILFEEGVIGRNAGDLPPPRIAHACIVGEEGCMNMDEVEGGREILQCTGEPAPAHAPVLRIPRHGGGGHAHNSRLRCKARGPVVRSNQQGLDAAGGEVMPKGRHGRRYPVDAREIHVR